MTILPTRTAATDAGVFVFDLFVLGSRLTTGTLSCTAFEIGGVVVLTI
jgi:hypothetical protein